VSLIPVIEFGKCVVNLYRNPPYDVEKVSHVLSVQALKTRNTQS